MSLVMKAAPEFTAKAVFADGAIKELSLKDFSGKYVCLFFYPFDFTFVCPTEILAYNHRVTQFQELNCQLLGVSIDSHHVHRAWRGTKIEDGGIGEVAFPLVADVNKTIANDYGVLLPGGMALRGLFLIDPKGNVVHETINNLDIGRNADETLRVLEAAHFAAEHGEVCPAGWTKGQSGMKANPAGVASYLAKNASKL